MIELPSKRIKEITDYFNYGFNETTFKHYARKVRETAKFLDKEVTENPGIKKDISTEENARIFKDNLPVEFGGIG